MFLADRKICMIRFICTLQGWSAGIPPKGPGVTHDAKAIIGLEN